MVIETAIGGETVTRTVEGRERYPVSVRYARDFRDSLPASARCWCRPRPASPARRNWPASRFTTGPAMIRDEGGLLAGYVYVDTASRTSAGT